jgi:hypothetical protein
MQWIRARDELLQIAIETRGTLRTFHRKISPIAAVWRFHIRAKQIHRMVFNGNWLNATVPAADDNAARRRPLTPSLERRPNRLAIMIPTITHKPLSTFFVAQYLLQSEGDAHLCNSLRSVIETVQLTTS